MTLTVLASLQWLPVKILLLTYKALNNRAPSYLKDLIIRYLYLMHFALKLQVYLLFPEFLKVEWEAEPSVIRLPLLWNQLSVCVWEADTLSNFKIRLKTLLLDKAYS